jgi:hypothetical protein
MEEMELNIKVSCLENTGRRRGGEVNFLGNFQLLKFKLTCRLGAN